jgi:hypothetical protein
VSDRTPDNDVLMPIERVERLIHLIRDEKVMLDSDLADLYGVDTRTLMQAVKRNIDRFPSDFMFQLSIKEDTSLRSQSVISKNRGGRRYPPYAFTEQGVAMLSSVLRSERAIKVNIAIMRTFVQLRQMMQSNEKLSKQLDNMDKKYDEQFRIVFKAIQQLMTPPTKPKRKMGFDAG